MALISEVAEKIYEIQPEHRWSDPLCSVYFVVDDKTALIETGPSVQAADILEAVGKLGYDARNISYIILTHSHPDHAGGVGLLAQRLPQAQVVAHQGTARRLAGPSILARVMQGFKDAFGDDAEERYGAMLPVAEGRFRLGGDGESIALGERELNVIQTPGHDRYHLSFLDTKTEGLFCGDALGGYWPEIEATSFTCVAGFDLELTLESMDKLRKLNPSVLFFSHYGVSREVAQPIQRAADDVRGCADIVLNALRAGETQEEMARRAIDFLARGSALAKAELSAWPRFIPLILEGYPLYFKQRNMI